MVAHLIEITIMIIYKDEKSAGLDEQIHFMLENVYYHLLCYRIC